MVNINIQNELVSALKELYKNDFSLIERRCSERSIVFKLGVYLDRNFKRREIDVDCEYNKNGYKPKSLMKRRLNYPDLIVHKRDNNLDNLLIIEVKTSSDRNKKHFQNDIDKLKGFTEVGKYSYCLGAHIFISKNRCSIAWYSKGNFLSLDSYSVSANSLNLIEGNDNMKLYAFEKYHRKIQQKE